jgi:hypothetical protein
MNDSLDHAGAEHAADSAVRLAYLYGMAVHQHTLRKVSQEKHYHGTLLTYLEEPIYDWISRRDRTDAAVGVPAGSEFC